MLCVVVVIVVVVIVLWYKHISYGHSTCLSTYFPWNSLVIDHTPNKHAIDYAPITNLTDHTS